LTGTLANAQVAVNAIDGTKITDNTITSTEIAANTINAGNIAANAIGTSELNAFAVNADKIAANAITATKIAAGVITGDKISANTITGGLIAASGIITNSAQINDAVIINAKIQNAAVDTLKVAGDSITITDFTDFSTQSGSGPYTFTTGVNLAYSGDIVAIATIQMGGAAGDGDTATFKLYIDGTVMTSISFIGQGLIGLHTMSGSKSLGTGFKTVQAQVSGLSGIGSPAADCQITIFRRYR
jgi:hypothetical protein